MIRPVSKDIVILFNTNIEDMLDVCDEIDSSIDFCRTKMYDGFAMVNFASEKEYYDYGFEETVRKVVAVLDRYKIIYKYVKLEF